MGDRLLIILLYVHAVCTLACDPGYSLTQDCTCTITDICVADNPCKNGALCFQLEPFDTSDYMCNCTSNFIGENCTGI